MKITEFVKENLMNLNEMDITGKSELEPYEDVIMYFDEFEDRDIIFMESPRLVLKDGTDLRAIDIEVRCDNPEDDISNMNSTIDKLFSEHRGTIYLYGIGYYDKCIRLRYVIYDDEEIKMRLFYGTYDSVEKKVNDFLKIIGKDYNIMKILQSTDGHQNFIIISIWYQLK